MQLLIAIEKEKMTVGTYGVQFAVERRKKEMQLLPHYLPLFLGFMPSLAYISLATIFHVFPHNYLGLALSQSLANGKWGEYSQIISLILDSNSGMPQILIDHQLASQSRIVIAGT